MNDLARAMIAMQEQALELQRQQLAFAQRWMTVGGDAVSAQKQAADAYETGMKAWRGWFDLWMPKR